MRLCHLLLDQMHTDHIKQSIKPNGALIWSYNQKAQSIVALPSRLGDSSNAYPGFAAKRSTVSWPSSSTSSANAASRSSSWWVRLSTQSKSCSWKTNTWNCKDCYLPPWEICHLRVLYSTKYTEVQKPQTTLNTYGISFKPGNDQGFWFHWI